MLHPLPAQDDHQAQRGPVNRQDEQAPVEERFGPGPPGDRLPLGQALVEITRRLGVLRRQPARHMRVDQVGPFVFWRGVVVDAGENRQQVLGEADGGNGGGQQGHNVDGGQFGGAKGPGPLQQPQDSVDQADEDEKHEDRRRGVEIVIQQRPLDDHVGVGQGHSEEQGDQAADHHCAQGDARCQGRAIGSGGNFRPLQTSPFQCLPPVGTARFWLESWRITPLNPGAENRRRAGAQNGACPTRGGPGQRGPAAPAGTCPGSSVAVRPCPSR